MNVDLFIDTIILVYAHDVSAGLKHQRARALVQSFWEKRERPWISIQVLQELHVTMIRKSVATVTSKDLVGNYLQWRLIENNRSVFLKALENQLKWNLSFWDASILAAAQQGGVSTLLSEDFNAGQNYEGVTVANPFSSSLK